MGTEIATTEITSPEKSTEGSGLDRLAALPARLDDEMLGNVEQYARSAPPPLPTTDEKQMLKFMRLMSDMPRQNADAATAAVKVENMLRHLGHLPRACLNWMMGQVHARFTFYPSIKELLDLAGEWERKDDAVLARAKAGRIALDERQARLDDARRALQAGELDQDGIDALPEQSRRILEAEGLLWRCDCGSYAPRRQRHDVPFDAELDEIVRRVEASFPTRREQAA